MRSMEIDFKMIKGPEDSKQENFAEMCCQLFQEEYPDANIKRTAPPNISDAGVDFYGTFDGKVKAFQCKYFPHQYEQSQLNQIKSSLKTAVEKRTQYNWNEWILCLPRTLTLDQKQKINNLAKTYYNVNLDYVEETELRRRLSKHEHIVRQFFPSPQSSAGIPLVEPQFEAEWLEVKKLREPYPGHYVIYMLNIKLINKGTAATKNFAIEFFWWIHQPVTDVDKEFRIDKQPWTYKYFRINFAGKDLLPGDNCSIFDKPDAILCKFPRVPPISNKEYFSKEYSDCINSAKIYWKVFADGAQPREGNKVLMDIFEGKEGVEHERN